MTGVPAEDRVGSPLYRRVERRVQRLAREMIDRFVEEIPLYAMLPREQLEGEILALTTANLRLFFAILREDRALGDDELVDIRTSAARRAEERVPLDAVLTAYHIGARIGWRALVEEASADEHAALIDAGFRVLQFAQQVTAAVAAAYLEEQQTIYGEEREARRALASALLAGEPAEALAGRARIALAAAYLVLALRIGPHPDEADTAVSATVAARRKCRRVQAAVDAWAGESVLGILEPTGGALLLPIAAGAVASALEDVPELAQVLAKAAGADLHAGGAVASGIADVARAGTQAQDIVRLALRLGRPAGGYLLRDVLLEYQLTRPSDAQDELARLLDPLDRNPGLGQTLDAYLEHDLDRRSTAAALHVHPNTLDYRLRRIIELTGLDPSTARGLQLLAAATAARRLGG
jgi:hypothetical protein